MGLARAKETCEKRPGKILKAVDYPLGFRIYGRRIFPTFEFLKANGTAITSEDDIQSWGKYAVYEVNVSDSSVTSIKNGGKTTDSDGNSKSNRNSYALTYKDNKRWFNISEIVESYKKGLQPCHLQRNYPFIGPKHCFFANDFIGRVLDKNADPVTEVPIGETDEEAFVNVIIESPNGTR